MNNINFNELGLSTKVLKSIETLGFVNPTKIQKEVIPLILKNYDVIGQAQTGTGKTLAYTASILSKMDVSTNIVKAIILTPTRELALQVSEEFESLNKSSKFNILPVFGGSSIEMQLRALKKGVDIVVGTPGRVIDLINRKALDISNIEFFVLDEADEMLNMGFLEDIEFIFKKTKQNKQVLLFSATMPKGILKLTETYMKVDYQYIKIESTSRTATSIKQYYYLVNDKIRLEALCRVLDVKNPKLAIIFCQTKRDVDKLLTDLSARNYSVEAMHGDIAQNMRIQTLERFKTGSFKILIATDVAARGIHVDNIDLVVNYNIPQDVEAYIHRIGRTGRANNEGTAISFVNNREQKFMDEVMKVAKCTIEKKSLPSSVEIIEGKYQEIINSVHECIVNKENTECIKYVSDLNKTDLVNFASALIKVTFDKEIGSDFNKELVVKEEFSRERNPNVTRVFLTIGKMDNVKKGSLLDFLKTTTKIDKDSFKNIEIMTKFTFMDVKNSDVDKLIKSLYNKKFNNRIVRVEKAKKR